MFPIPMGFTPDLNIYRALEGNPIRWMDAMGLEVPKYGPENVSACFNLLKNVTIGPVCWAKSPVRERYCHVS